MRQLDIRRMLHKLILSRLWDMSLPEGKKLFRENKTEQRGTIGGMREKGRTIMKILGLMPAGLDAVDEM